MSEEDKNRKYENIKKATMTTAGSAITILIIDLFIMGAPAFTVFVIIYLLFYFIPVTLFSIRNKQKRQYFGYKALIYFLMVVIVISVTQIEESITMRRADSVIAAIDKFYEDKSHYPDSLLALVPDYINSIPKARVLPVLLAPSQFFLINPHDELFLMYVNYPPFGRMSWSFKDKQWISFD